MVSTFLKWKILSLYKFQQFLIFEFVDISNVENFDYISMWKHLIAIEFYVWRYKHLVGVTSKFTTCLFSSITLRFSGVSGVGGPQGWLEGLKNTEGLPASVLQLV